MKIGCLNFFSVIICSMLIMNAQALRGAGSETAVIKPLRTVVDLDLGEAREISLPDGEIAEIVLIDKGETVYAPTGAIVNAWVRVRVNDHEIVLDSGNYNLPVTVSNVQIDCPVTGAYRANSRSDPWNLKKDARLRVWPAGSQYMTPGTFVYPIKQKFFASKSQMCNEPVFVDGGTFPADKIYYHYGLDFGGAEGMDEVVSSTDGLVVSAGDSVLPGYENSPAAKRYDVVYIQDGRGWLYRYSHLWAFHLAIKPGVRVKMGQKIGILGKEGGSGGWSHLHFGINSKLPSGEWCNEQGYAYTWEAYLRQYDPALIAVARPHLFAHVGEQVKLSGAKSWSSSGKIERYEWQLSSGDTASGAECTVTYERPGQYSEILKIADGAGRIDYDFAVITVIDTAKSPAYQIPPVIHSSFHPTFNITAGEPVTFLARSFDTEMGKEVFDFGDGSAPVTVYSNTGYGSKVLRWLGLDNKFLRFNHHMEGYGQTVHRFNSPGHYLVKASHTAKNGYTATSHLYVIVGPDE